MVDEPTRNTNWLLILGGIVVLALIIGLFYTSDWDNMNGTANISPAAGDQNTTGGTMPNQPPAP